MARGLTSAMATQVAGLNLNPVHFIEGDFDSGALRYWTGYGDITWNGETWQGSGEILTLSPIAESAAVKAVGGSVTLTGLPSALIQIAHAEPYQGRRATIWFGVLTDAGDVVDDPYEEFAGRMDTITDEDDGSTCTLTLTLENDLIDLEGAADRRLTPEDQALDFPQETGSPHHRDTGFDQVASLQALEIVLE